tara:strand:+ start:1037 stop:1540 length:504 start_codon:yes stop_codon:yes gene_type:complete
MPISCCKAKKTNKQCIRKKDKKVFSLPRKHTKIDCQSMKRKGFSQRSSCAPYRDCPQFLYNPKNPKKSFDVYIDKNPNDTIPIRFRTIQDVKNTIGMLERLYKQKRYSHKRIWQVAMILKVRLDAIYRHTNTKRTHRKLAHRYFTFLKKRTQQKGFLVRSRMKFSIY